MSTEAEEAVGPTLTCTGANVRACMKTALISPDAFSGNSSWSDWVDHFEAVAKVNQWDEDTKLIWLPVKLKRKAQTAWKRLSEETREDCQLAMDAFQKRFEPSIKPERYATEFRLRKRKSGEQWADIADQCIR